MFEWLHVCMCVHMCKWLHARTHGRMEGNISISRWLGRGLVGRKGVGLLRFAVLPHSLHPPTPRASFREPPSQSHTGSRTQLSQCLDQMAKTSKTGLSTFFWKDVWFINCVAAVTECCMVTTCDRASCHHLTAKAKPHSLSAVVSRCFSGSSSTVRQGRPQGSPAPAPSRVLTCLPLEEPVPAGSWQSCPSPLGSSAAWEVSIPHCQ